MPRDGTATRQRILDAAERLAIDNGFAATSIDQVIAASGTSKGAFFHHFDSKLALARALVERYAAADIDQLNAALAAVRAASDDPAEQVIAFIRYFEDGADELMAGQSSCLYISVLTERQLVRAGTRELIVRAVLAYRTELSRLLQAALRARAAEPDQPGAGAPGGADAAAEDDDSLGAAADALADHVFVTFEGAFILARSTGYPGHMRAQLSVLRQLLQSLLAPAAARAEPPGAAPLEAAGQPAPAVA
ncbi:MAG TPA: helix-turn-helix domain-containing protein [Streptosporangiaceae bacterium]|nr:helix-turn-helix domain-containing protein [Streptosporangiaceae bacterium]